MMHNWRAGAGAAALIATGIGLAWGAARPVYAGPLAEDPKASAHANAGSAEGKQGETMTDVQIVTDGINEFGLDLYGRLGAQDGNVLVSPYSVSTALAMTAAGARGETVQQMEKVLHVWFVPPAPKGEPMAGDAHAAFAKLDKWLKEANDPAGCRLDVANALWGQTGEGFLKEFLDLTAKHYGAGLRQVDFAQAAEAVRTINEWVADKTQQKIKDLLGAQDVSRDTRLVLTNAVYLKAGWARPFDVRWTKDAPFHAATGKDVTVPMMHLTDDFGLASDKDVDVLVLPYVGKRLRMVVVLPKKPDGLADVEKSLTMKQIHQWVYDAKPHQPRPVAVQLPRFGFDGRYELTRMLAAMGMPDAFSGGGDFSGMNGKRDLLISAVIHQTHIGVDEAGTEAAAATAVVMARGARPQSPAPFVADHPFLFLIQDNESGVILFLGRLVNPKV